MARIFVLIVTIFLMLTTPEAWHLAGNSGGGSNLTFSVSTIPVGDEFFAVGQLSGTGLSGSFTRSLPTGYRRGTNCFYSSWYLLRRLSGGFRRYDVIIEDACTNHQIFPGDNSKCTVGVDYQGDTNPSECVDLPPRTVPAGYGPSDCGALSETASHLTTNVTPLTFDLGTGANLTATTSFDKDFTSSLSDGICTSVLSWNVLAWHLKWTDGTVSTAPGSGHSGIISSHQVAAVSGGTGTQVSSVEAVAHVHVQGTGVGFDANGNTTLIPVDAFVDVSNVASSSGTGSAPIYTAPVLAVGGIGRSQNGFGDFALPNLSSVPVTHLAVIRGHLLAIYPRTVVISPGTEAVSGVVVGASTTTTIGWTYTGGPTNAPIGEETNPGSSGGPNETINVQWNTAEPIDSLGRPEDEKVPVALTARTVYPDGHVITNVISGSILVTIYYVASTTSA